MASQQKVIKIVVKTVQLLCQSCLISKVLFLPTTRLSLHYKTQERRKKLSDEAGERGLSYKLGHFWTNWSKCVTFPKCIGVCQAEESLMELLWTLISSADDDVTWEDTHTIRVMSWDWHEIPAIKTIIISLLVAASALVVTLSVQSVIHVLSKVYKSCRVLLNPSLFLSLLFPICSEGKSCWVIQEDILNG